MKQLIVKDLKKHGEQTLGEPYVKYRELLSLAMAKQYSGTFPLQIDFDTVDACNLRCIVCSDVGRKRTGLKVDAEDIKSVIDEGVGQGLHAINIGACGEPFLNKTVLFDICDYAKSKGILDIFVHSNFLLPDHEDIKRLVESGVNRLCLSVDACTPDTYALVRGGDFDKLMDNVRFLKSHMTAKQLVDPFIRVSAVPCHENQHELDTFFEFWKKYADIIEVQDFQQTPFQRTKGNILTKKPVPDCSLPWWRLMFWPNGTIAACCTTLGLNDDISLSVFQFHKERISDYWTGDKINRIRANILKKEWDKVPSCKRCMNNIFIYEG